jgi:hypothetical protein
MRFCRDRHESEAAPAIPPGCTCERLAHVGACGIALDAKSPDYIPIHLTGGPMGKTRFQKIDARRRFTGVDICGHQVVDGPLMRCL